jgi:phosphoglycolate phosphatase-like HAD superfamily hydrolase
MELAEAVIFDMDGTLCDVSSIRHYLQKPKGKKDFESFHSNSVDCPPHEWVADRARKLAAEGYAVLIVTARQEKWFYHTLVWLVEKEVPFDDIYMRTNGDFRPDYEIKQELLERIRAVGYDPILAFDDNPAIITMWQENNIPTVVVPGWDRDLKETEITREELLDNAALL